MFFVGTAGVCNGSRIKGHLKYGGKRVVEQHSRSGAVLMTSEQMTSKICPFGFFEIRLAKATVDGKSVRVHGAVECINPKCDSFGLGYTKRARDSNATTNFALSGFR
jgi:hypothetical protein